MKWRITARSVRVRGLSWVTSVRSWMDGSVGPCSDRNSSGALIRVSVIPSLPLCTWPFGIDALFHAAFSMPSTARAMPLFMFCGFTSSSMRGTVVELLTNWVSGYSVLTSQLMYGDLP
ncbi:hypothetical protein D9M69_493480 [compost metagenome]